MIKSMKQFMYGLEQLKTAVKRTVTLDSSYKWKKGISKVLNTILTILVAINVKHEVKIARLN